MKKHICILILLISSLHLLGDDNTIVIEKANKEYSNGQYNNAVKLYEQVIEKGFESYQLYYNLGNAYFKINDITSAILYYEKAKKLNPSDEEIDFNLNVANTRIADKIETLPELFFWKWWRGIYGLFSSDMWARIIVFSFFLFFVCLSLYLLSKSIPIKKIAFWFCAIFLFITIMTTVFAYKQYNETKTNKEAIVFAPSVTVKSSPNENSTDLFVIHEGIKVKITNQIGNWSEIKIANGSVGWIETSTFRVI